MTTEPDSTTPQDESPDCSFFLDNGQQCRAPARHDSPFCRHHAPEVRARRRQAAKNRGAVPAKPKPSEKDGFDPWILRAYWRTHHRLIPAFNDGQLDDTFEMILEALADRLIAPRSAGSLLRAILDRRRQLAEEAQYAAFLALCEQAHRNHTRKAGTSPFEGPANCPVSTADAGKTAPTRV